MKISTAKADSFIANPSADVAVFLLYGPDQGLVSARAAALARHFTDDLADPFQVARLEAGALRRDIDRFWDEVGALSLTGGRRLVLVRDAGDGLAEPMAQYLDDIAGRSEDAAAIILEAGELGARSKLRKVCEADDGAAAIASYPLEGRALRDYVVARLRQDGVEVDRGAADYLAFSLGPDHALRESELMKLTLYGGAGAKLSVADVVACIGDTSGVALSDLAMTVGAGEVSAADRSTSRLIRDGQSPVAALRAVQSHFGRLYRAALARSAGTDIDGAMAVLRPPVFWKDKDRFRQQLRYWTEQDLAAVARRLASTEISLKTTGQPAPEILRYELLAIAGLGRRLSNNLRQ